MGSGSSSSSDDEFETAASVTTTVRTEDTPLPEGYVHVYAGFRMDHHSYTSPIISIHLFNVSAETTNVDYARSNTKNPEYQRDPAFQLGLIQSKTESNVSFDEQVLVIPIDDIVSIFYQTAYKKDLKRVMILPVDERGWCAKLCCCCCDLMSSCCCSCCCPCCKKKHPDEVEECVTLGKRTIIVNVEYVRYRKVQAPALVRVMDSEVKFDPTTMIIEKLHFYLLIDREYDATAFNYQRNQAEMLSCLVTHIKQMSSVRYPSEKELQDLVNMSRRQLFGAEVVETPTGVQRIAQTASDQQNLSQPYLPITSQPKIQTVNIITERY